LGNREEYLLKAMHQILNSSSLHSLSSIWETSPWGGVLGGNFLNCVLLIKTTLSPFELLQSLSSIEDKLGRKRDKRYSPRQIDIDILFYGGLILTSPTLTIPHPSLHLRKFVLLPLKEVSPNLIHPLLRKNITSLLRGLKSEEKCVVYLSKEDFLFKLRQCGA